VFVNLAVNADKKMLKFARRRARSSEREPVKCLVMNNSLSKPRASSAERAAKPAESENISNCGMEDPVTPVRVESRTASIQKSGHVRRSIFQDSETDMPAYTMSVNSDACISPACESSNKNRNSGLFCRSGSVVKATFAPMTTTLSHLTTKIGQVQIGNPEEPSVSDVGSVTMLKSSQVPVLSTLYTPPPVLPRKPKVDNFLQQGNLWKMELLDTSAESGYGTDSSDNNSLKSLNATEPSPPPLPKRKPRRKVQFDSYVLLIQSLKDRDLKGILSTIFNVSSEALCTEDVIYHFHTAILRQDYEVCELLVRGGAEVNTFDHRGWSALHCACSLARLDMIKLLLQNGAAVLARTHHSSQTATQLLPIENPAYTQCLAYMRCMEECLGTVNNRMVLAAASYRACRIDELTISKGDRLFVQRRGDIDNEMWWWVKNSRGEEGYVLRDLLSLNSRHS